MEYASYLAGERWSDHPACTHPLLGELARQVNDFTSDHARQQLVQFVPDLVGLTGADLVVYLRIALRSARTALPIAAERHQRIMAVGILTCERLRADLDGCPGAPVSAASREALAAAGDVAGWASSFTRHGSISHKAFRRETAPTIVRYAVQGIAEACTPNPDAILRELLAGAIDDSTTAQGSDQLSRRVGRERLLEPAGGGVGTEATAGLSGTDGR